MSTTTYRLRDPQRGVLGPLGFEAVRDLLRAGAINIDSQIAREDEPFRSAGGLEEFASLMEDLQLRGGGSLSTMGFALLLYRLHRQRATGRLELRRDRDCKLIYLDRGKPVFVRSNQPRERFGQYLLGQGLLDQHELRVALESMHVDHNHLMHTIVRLGLLDANDLEVALREQQIARLVDLCRWTDGDYDWLPEETYQGDLMPLEIDVVQLLVNASRMMTDMELSDWLAPLLSRRLCTKDPSRVSELHLGPLEQRVVYYVTGKATGVQIVNQLGVDDDQRGAVLRVLYLLQQTDNLRAQ